MAWRPGTGLLRLGRKLWIPLLLGVLVLSVVAAVRGAPALPPAPFSTLHAPSSTAAGSPAASTTPVATAPAKPIPQAGSTTGTFYSNTTGFAVPTLAQGGCSVSGSATYIYNYCYNQAVTPSLMKLGNGNFGLSYEFNTNATGSTCSGASSSIHTAIGWSVSTTGGTSFGAPSVIANTTCTYLQAIDPAFASSGASVYGSFVEENFTTHLPATFGQGALRSPDALGFVVSTNNGTSFGAVKTLNKSGNLSHPEIAAFGKTVYILFENLSTSASTVSTGGTFCYLCATINPVGIFFTYSTNAGSTWSKPVQLPGINATALNFSLGPSIAVNKTGTVAVSYFTNMSCASWYPYATGICYDYGFNLDVLTSTNNGSTWSKPIVVAPTVGIQSNYDGYSYPEIPASQWEPQSQISFNANGQTVYVVWSGVYNKTANQYTYDQWCCSGISFASGPLSGTGWHSTLVSTVPSLDGNNYDDMFNPGFGASGSTLYVTYTWNNESYCALTCSGSNYVTATFNQRLEWSTNGGLTWSQPLVLQVSKMGLFCGTYCAQNQFEGYSASIAFSSTGSPRIAYAMPEQTVNSFASAGTTYWYNYTYPTNLTVAFPYTGTTVTLTIDANGLPTGKMWPFILQGLTVVGSGTSFQITNVPSGMPILVFPSSVAGGYGQQIVPSSSEPGSFIITNNQTIYFNYSLSFQLLLFVNPAVIPNIYLYATVNSVSYSFDANWYCYYIGSTLGCYTYRYWCTSISGCQNTPASWYFPNGTKLQFVTYPYYSTYVTYWNGTGPGAYNGTGYFANITMNGVVNETGWAGAFGLYNESFYAQGLPSSSVFHYTFNGVTYTAPSTGVSIAPNITTGAYQVTNAWANSSTAGWEYFGTPDTGNPVVVPSEPIVNFTFAYVDVGGSTGTVSFHATGLTFGTIWHFEFNGTEYSSATPWINITTHSGTFAVSAFPVVASNGTVGYTPSGVSTTMSVTAGSTYSIGFVQAYQVVATAGIGGSITGTGRGSFWVAANSAVSLHASAGPAYQFGGWTGVGSGSYTGSDSWANFTAGGPVTESASFFPLPQNRFNLTFNAVGLAPGTWWTVYLSGVGYSSNQPSLVIHNLYPCGTLGTYNLSIPFAYVNGTQLTRFAPGSYARTVCTNGATMVSVVFAAQYFVTLEATAGGIAEVTVGASTSTTSLWVGNGSSVALSAVAIPGYQFLGWNGTGAGSYSGANLNAGLVVVNPLTELAVFAKPIVPPPPRYWVDFHLAAALSAGTAWSLTVGGVGYASTGSDLNVTGLLAGSYALVVKHALSPDGFTEYVALSPPPTVGVTHNLTVPLSFATSFWVSVTANYGGSIVLPSASGLWVVAGQTVTLNATPNVGFVFAGWVGTGVGSYTGPAPLVTIHLAGPVTEVASFAQAPPATKTITNAFWSAPTTWIGLAVAGLVVGLVAGLVAGRRKGGAAAVAMVASTAPPAPEPWQESPPPSNPSTEGGNP